MPSRLPVQDIFAGLVTSIGTAIRYWFHYTLVAFAWLGVVPLTACKWHYSIVKTKWRKILSAVVILFQHIILHYDHLFTYALNTCFHSAWSAIQVKLNVRIRIIVFSLVLVSCLLSLKLMIDWNNDFLFAFFNRSYLQVFIYRLCELSPYPAIRYAFNVSLNYSLVSVFAPSLSHCHAPVYWRYVCFPYFIHGNPMKMVNI